MEDDTSPILDHDTTPASDDDTSTSDDDGTGDDDASAGDDDASAGDDDASADDDDQNPGGSGCTASSHPDSGKGEGWAAGWLLTVAWRRQRGKGIHPR